MDLLDRLLGHDAWTKEQLLHCAASLSEEELDREFEMSHQTLRATFDHLIFNMEAWSDAMAGRPIRSERPKSIPDLQARLKRAAADLAEVARPIAARAGWDEVWTDPDDHKERTYGGTIAHVVTHSMHHRAQLLFMLKALGVKNLPEGDVLSWEYRDE